MGINLMQLVLSYPFWTLICAVFFPLVAAVATFLCLSRATAARRTASYFIMLPLFAALSVVFVSDTGNITSDLLNGFGLSYPGIVSLLIAISLGGFYLSLTALICGAGVLKTRAAVTHTVAALIFLAANVFIIYGTWTAYSSGLSAGLLREDGGIIYIAEALPFLKSLGLLPTFILESGAEMLSLLLLLLYLIVYFLAFIPLRSPEEIMREDLERRRRAALLSKSERFEREERRLRRHSDEDDVPDCCANCQYATAMKSDPTKMVCDKYGVVSSSHSCKRHLYDPIKRTARRPQINPLTPTAPDGESDN